MKIEELTDLLKNGQPQSHAAFAEIFAGADSLSEAARLRKLWSVNKRLQNLDSAKAERIRIAVTGSGTLDYLADLVADAFRYSGFDIELYTSAYGEYVSDLMNADSDLWKFLPDCVVFVTDSTTLWELSSVSMDSVSAGELIEKDIDFLSQLLTAPEGTACQFYALNALPSEFRFPGGIRLSQPGSAWNFVLQWNQQLVAELGGRVTVVDVLFEACRRGLSSALNLQQWFESKVPFDLDFHVAVARMVASAVQRAKSADKKVVVVDCDNTIWGGVVGDDGIEGIEIGSTSTRGQAYASIQAHLLELKKAGVLLAVASKNQQDTVFEVFRDHPEMVLRPDDIVSFKVDWQPKADNIASLAKELNLGLDSFVFLDDNPAEIEIVNQYLPEVSTIQASLDPVKTLEQLMNSELLYRSSFTREDEGRTQLYKAEAGRKKLETTVTNYDEYLASLEMSATVEKISPLNIIRATQLINKSNQFNLTTIRRTETEMAELCERPNWVGFTVRLTDKFGDQGIIAVVIAETAMNAFSINTFVMSCRVLKRGVEQLIANTVHQLASELECNVVLGCYRPTAKNIIVETLYEDLGFELIERSAEEVGYKSEISEYKPFSHQIRVDQFTIG